LFFLVVRYCSGDVPIAITDYYDKYVFKYRYISALLDEAPNVVRSLSECCPIVVRIVKGEQRDSVECRSTQMTLIKQIYADFYWIASSQAPRNDKWGARNDKGEKKSKIKLDIKSDI